MRSKLRLRASEKRFIGNERGQVIILFSLVVVSVIASLVYLHAQNIAAGIESSRTMLAYPKEEMRNLREIWNEMRKNESLRPLLPEINDQIQILCAKKGWVCNLEVNKLEFKTVEVEYCEGC
jgi:hypothetical protein